MILCEGRITENLRAQGVIGARAHAIYHINDTRHGEARHCRPQFLFSSSASSPLSTFLRMRLEGAAIEVERIPATIKAAISKIP